MHTDIVVTSEGSTEIPLDPATDLERTIAANLIANFRRELIPVETQIEHLSSPYGPDDVESEDDAEEYHGERPRAQIVKREALRLLIQ